MIILLLIFILFIPLENRTSVWLNFGSGINFTNIFIILLIVAWLLKREKDKSSFVTNPLRLPLLIFMLATYFSFFTGFMQLGIPFFGNEFRTYKSFITTFILFFIVVNNVKDKKSMKLLFKVMAFMILSVAFMTIKEFREANIWHYDDGARVTLLGLQPNMLGAFFAQFLPIFAGLAFLSKKLKNKILYIGLFSICLPALMFTYSRGAYLAIAGALIIMLFTGRRKIISGFMLMAIIAIFAQSILFGHGRIIPVSVRERFDSMKQEGREEDKSIELREAVWVLAKQRISESPIFGYGFGASDHILYLEEYNIDLDTHNMYLDIALECGIPTLLIFIWLLFKMFKIGLWVFRMSDDYFYKAIGLGFCGCVSALAIGNFFGTRLTLFAANGYFAVVMGIVTRIYINLKNEELQKRLIIAKKNNKNTHEN